MLFDKKKKLKGGEVITDTPWPQDGDIYFWVRSDIGQICKSEWNESKNHLFRKSTGNCFRTRTEAQDAISREIAYVTSKEFK